MNKILSLAIVIFGFNAFAGVCEQAYSDFAKNSDVISFDESGAVSVVDRSRLVINEKRGSKQKLVIVDLSKKSRTTISIEREKGAVVSISKTTKGQTQIQKFDGSCSQEQAMMDENTRTKIDAAEEDWKNSQGAPVPGAR